jgi:hypothetical protein
MVTVPVFRRLLELDVVCLFSGLSYQVCLNFQLGLTNSGLPVNLSEGQLKVELEVRHGPTEPQAEAQPEGQ